ncbi:hypothetical protein F4W66_24350 (plasmid) [Escherichia coli]|nr:hypothetical protein F4W66_24350 [Escherichia coli]
MNKGFVPTPCYISITGQTRYITADCIYRADSVGNIYVQGHEDEILVQNSLHNVTDIDPQSGQPARVSDTLTNLSFYRGAEQSGSALILQRWPPAKCTNPELHWWRTSNGEQTGALFHYHMTVRRLLI